MRPTRLVMEDALRGNEQSVLDYSGMKLRDLPDKMFTKEYLSKLGASKRNPLHAAPASRLRLRDRPP